MLGKFTRDKVELSEQDSLMESSERQINQRPISNDRDHAARPRELRSNNINDQKLANVEEIARCENVYERGRAMLEWIDSLAPEEFEAAAASLRSLDLSNYQRDEYAMMLLTAWAEVDPVAALAHAEENYRKGARRAPTSRETARIEAANRNPDLIESERAARWLYNSSNEAASTVLSTWAIRDPEAAIAWAKSTHQGEEKNPHMLGIILGLSESDPARATALLQEMPVSPVREDAVKAMMPHLLKMGSESAQKWIAELNDENLRQAASSCFADAIARQSPAGAAPVLK